MEKRGHISECHEQDADQHGRVLPVPQKPRRRHEQAREAVQPSSPPKDASQAPPLPLPFARHLDNGLTTREVARPMRLGIKTACDMNENADDDNESAHDDVVAHVFLEVLRITKNRCAHLATIVHHLVIGVLGTKVTLASLLPSHIPSHIPRRRRGGRRRIPMPFCIHSTPAFCSGGHR